MEQGMLDQDCLFDLIEICITKGLHEKEIISVLSRKLESILEYSYKWAKWTSGHFLSLTVGFFFLWKLSEPKYVRDKRDNRNVIPAQKTREDILKILNEVKVYFIKKNKILENAVRRKKIENTAAPMDWLELFQKTNGRTSGSYDNSAAIFTERNIWIAKNLAEFIRYGYYNVDPKISDHGIFPANRITVAEAAEELRITPDGVISTSFNSDYGFYIQSDLFKIKKFIHSPITRLSVDENAEFSYIHHYRGLVRIMKTSVFYPDSTLEKIYNGGVIKVRERDDYVMVPLQSSVAQCAQGLTSKYSANT